jgi:hypothetical protein
MVVIMSAKPLTQKEFAASVAEMWGSAVESTYKDLLREAVLAEREACAKLCDELFADVPAYSAPDCAAAIRARK